jgi:hypothetical protein
VPDSGARLAGGTENHTRMGEAWSGLRPARVDWDAPGRALSRLGSQAMADRVEVDQRGGPVGL